MANSTITQAQYRIYLIAYSFVRSGAQIVFQVFPSEDVAAAAAAALGASDASRAEPPRLMKDVAADVRDMLG